MTTHRPAHRRHLVRLFRPHQLLLTAAVTAATTGTGPALAAEPPVPPPPPPQAPTPIDDVPPVETIFTYRLDGRCRVERTRKLQGPAAIRWRDADSALGITREETVFRYVAGQRTQLRERRVKLLGEMVQLLVAELQPAQLGHVPHIVGADVC